LFIEICFYKDAGLSKTHRDTGTDAGTALMAADANSAVLLSAQRLLTPINAGQTYAINSSDAFQFGRISLRINTLPLFTSVQSLFLILQCSESFILVYYLQQHILQCRSGMFTLR